VRNCQASITEAAALHGKCQPNLTEPKRYRTPRSLQQTNDSVHEYYPLCMCGQVEPDTYLQSTIATNDGTRASDSHQQCARQWYRKVMVESLVQHIDNVQLGLMSSDANQAQSRSASLCALHSSCRLASGLHILHCEFAYCSRWHR
jgi:hypothetical protein